MKNKLFIASSAFLVMGILLDYGIGLSINMLTGLPYAMSAVIAGILVFINFRRVMWLSKSMNMAIHQYFIKGDNDLSGILATEQQIKTEYTNKEFAFVFTAMMIAMYAFPITGFILGTNLLLIFIALHKARFSQGLKN